MLTLRLRASGAALIAGDDASGAHQALARAWWMLTIVYLLVIWFMSVGKRAATGESTLVPGIGSLLLFVLIPYFDTGLRWLISRYFEKSEAGENQAGIDGQSPAIDAGAAPAEVGDAAVADEPGYLATALRYARLLMGLAILAIFVRLWHIGIEALASLLVDERFAGALFDIGITILLAPVRSQGVNRMDDSALIIRCKFTAVPGQQYLIRREAFIRIQKAFEAEGIQFAPCRVLVEATSPQEAARAGAGAVDREGESEARAKPDT